MKVPLTQGSYTTRSLMASCQRSVNLYGEANPPDSTFPFTYYPTPGLRSLATPLPGNARLDYLASNGNYYRVVGAFVYSVASDWTHTQIGLIPVGASICSMADNGLVAILVDGSASGYVIDLTNNAFSLIYNPSFYGADKVDYLDTFFIFNKPDSPSFYITISQPGYIDFSTPTVILGTIDGGSGYITGTYTNVPLSGGSGSGAKATIVIAGGVVTTVTITDPGIDYAATDILTVAKADVGGSGTGFQYLLFTAGAFNSLDTAQPTGMAGNLVSLAVAHRNIWIFKANATEVWYDTGAADFAFGPAPGIIIEHGCAALYSVCTYDGSVFWLGRDKSGNAIVFMAQPYSAKRISTHAIEVTISAYTDISDAVGFIYQQEGHTFYQLSFPTGDATWVYDLATDQWHERSWTDENGSDRRSRALLSCNAYSEIVASDWETGALYAYDLDMLTDNGSPITRRRGFPHMDDDGDRVMYRQFIAKMDCGASLDILSDDEPLVSLRWSDTQGHSWGNPVSTGMGATGQYLRSIQWQRLGMARDRVFEVFWSAPVKTAISGAFIEDNKAGT